MNTMDLVDKLVREFTDTPRVLIIDDEINFIELFRHTLEQCGCLVDAATTTDDAIDKIEYQAQINRSYDIIFLDLKMPPYHGPYVLERVKPIVPKVPIIIVTNYADSDLVNEAMKYGYVGLIQKKVLDFKEIEDLFWKHKIQINPLKYESNNPVVGDGGSSLGPRDD